jgi:hypothetical protein
LRRLQEWSERWQLKFNSTKCKVMHLGKRNKMHKYLMMENKTLKTLEETVEEKDSGVWTDDQLKFVKHIEKAASKSRQILGLIKKNHLFTRMVKS